MQHREHWADHAMSTPAQRKRPEFPHMEEVRGRKSLSVEKTKMSFGREDKDVFVVSEGGSCPSSKYL